MLFRMTGKRFRAVITMRRQLAYPSGAVIIRQMDFVWHCLAKGQTMPGLGVFS